MALNNGVRNIYSLVSEASEEGRKAEHHKRKEDRTKDKTEFSFLVINAKIFLRLANTTYPRIRCHSEC